MEDAGYDGPSWSDIADMDDETQQEAAISAFETAAKTEIDTMTAGIDPDGVNGAATAMDTVDLLINGGTVMVDVDGVETPTEVAGIGSIRSELGANINRLDHTIVNLGNMAENTEMAKGRIMDTDYAVESSNMMKNQMLTQMSMSMLSQANGMSGMVMSLVG
ncbi:hypothetical protein BIZ37_24010 [Photobacterium sp. BZF1]|nr:hypothetical protein [Photobacterium sp. BZF1]